MRERWSAKNKNHHPRDATMLEDKCRSRTKDTAANFKQLQGATVVTQKSPSLIEPRQTSFNQIKGKLTPQ
jgi:predicted transposase YbfD/YdcC|tara:strand:- start:2121 stop:2330 length:210 start_codon:yes stop_codon:yes gene_type:complete